MAVPIDMDAGGGGRPELDARVADAADPQPDATSIDGDAEVSDAEPPQDGEVADAACAIGAVGCPRCVQPEDCPEPLGECEARACTSGLCAAAPAPDGTGCDDHDLCTQTDSCTGGVCAGTDRVLCAAIDECSLGVCDPLTGTCTSPHQSDGFVCDDGDLAACTWRDTCESGTCTSGTPITCAPGARCEAGACVGAPCEGYLGLAGPPLIQVGGYPQAIVSADFDGDGEPDVATANPAGDTINVLFSLGDGRFAPAVSYAAGDVPWELVADDLNGDGDVDLAVAGSGTNSIRIFLNAGAGTFTAAAPIATLANPYAIASGDVNGDDTVDLIVSGGGQMPQLIVYLNDGSGSFSSSSITLETAAHDIELVDLDGDGARDIVIARNHPLRFDFEGYLAVMLNHGNGTFGSAVEYYLGTGTYSITSADFDQDGSQDVAVACADWRSAFVFLNTGDGTLERSAIYEIVRAYKSRDIKAADFDDDGFADLVMSNPYNGGQGTAGVFINRGDGTFSDDVEYVFGFSPYDAAVADFNGDGALDLMSAGGLGNELVVLLNDGDGRFGGHQSYGSPLAFPPLFADMDADRHLDLVMASSFDATMAIARNSGTGRVRYPDFYPVPDGAAPVAVADFSGDGRLDVAVLAKQDDALTIMSRDAGGGFSAGAPQAVRENVSGVAAGDLDQDGRVDLVVTDIVQYPALVTLQILRNQGDGTFAQDGQYELDAGPSVLARDVNGDELLDLVTFGSAIEVMLNLGGGRFAAPSTYLADEGEAIVALPDLNGDGFPDIASLSSSSFSTSSAVDVMFNDGEGGFGGKRVYNLGGNASAVAVADLDGDALADFVFVSVDRIAVSRNTGSGLAPPRYYVTRPGARSVRTADLDNDGRLDVVVNASNSFEVSLNVHLNRCL